jgi:hypothetical protein
MLATALAMALAAAAPPAAASAPEEARFDEALRAGADAFARRGDPAQLAEAIDAYERARTLRPGAAAAELGLARAQAFRSRAEPKAARAALRDCARAAERALRRASPAWARAVDHGDEASVAVTQVERDGAEPLYWLAACTMDLARGRGLAAVLAVKDEVRPMMERAAALDPGVDHAGPDRALGAWLAALPSAAGGGAAEARRHFDQARVLAPDDATRRVREAETWAVLVQDRALFVRLLDEVIASEPSANPALAPENALARKEAETLRARADRLF